LKIDFDPDKNHINIEKHGIPLSAASNFEWASAITWEDIRYSYGEKRLISLGYIGRRLHVLVHTPRLNSRRIISLRKANSREVNLYAET
jgi:uncharacterized DUF497 family protein|tara:strand:+ start:1190 stop:1456 length:267 start_codon:yes stop_codon:yes gene_type:complete